MKKKLSLFFYFALFCCLCSDVKSQVTEHKDTKTTKILATSYPDYKPFSYVDGEDVVNVFEKAIFDILNSNNIVAEYDTKNVYQQNIDNLQKGEVDIMFGIYNETQTDIKMFHNTEYMYPAVLQNPVSLVMLPKHKNKIKNVDDLKNTKGVYFKNDYLTDFVVNKMNEFGVKPEEDAFSVYQKLFLGEIDYIVGSYYFLYVQALEMGVKNYVSFSKKAIWTMPMFIGVSKSSKKYNRLKITLSKKIPNKEVSMQVEKALKNTVRKIEEKSIGVVPPTFVLKSENVILNDNQEKDNIEEK